MRPATSKTTQRIPTPAAARSPNAVLRVAAAAARASTPMPLPASVAKTGTNGSRYRRELMAPKDDSAYAAVKAPRNRKHAQSRRLSGSDAAPPDRGNAAASAKARRTSRTARPSHVPPGAPGLSNSAGRRSVNSRTAVSMDCRMPGDAPVAPSDCHPWRAFQTHQGRLPAKNPSSPQASTDGRKSRRRRRHSSMTQTTPTAGIVSQKFQKLRPTSKPSGRKRRAFTPDASPSSAPKNTASCSSSVVSRSPSA